MSKPGSSAVAALLLFLAATPAVGASLEGVRFEQRVTVEDRVLILSGAGLLRYMGIVKAYVGALYLPADIGPGDALADAAKRLEVVYLRPFDAEDFGSATIEGISRNVDPETLSGLMPKIEYHNSLYEDVGPGDRYALTYIPGRGTELTLNGEPKGVIEGAEFAAALFSIWLGPEPMSRSLKSALLGEE